MSEYLRSKSADVDICVDCGEEAEYVATINGIIKTSTFLCEECKIKRETAIEPERQEKMKMYSILKITGDAGFEKYSEEGKIEAESAFDALSRCTDWPATRREADCGGDPAHDAECAIAENPLYKNSRYSDCYEATEIDCGECKG